METEKSIRVTAEQAVSALIKRSNGKILLVSKEGLWTLPGGHIEQGEDSFGALLREMKEELGVNENELFIIDCFGPVLRIKDNDPKNPVKNFEIFYCKVGTETANRIRFKEKDESTFVWIKPLAALKLEILDGLAKEALRRYKDKFIHGQIVMRGNDGKSGILQRRAPNY